MYHTHTHSVIVPLYCYSVAVAAPCSPTTPMILLTAPGGAD